MQTVRADAPGIVVRDPHFDFSQPLPLYWFGDNAFLTFLFNGFNLTFPEGERSFVRAVNQHLSLIEDPLLRAQVKAFSGQEGHHALAHEQVFDALRAQGFDLEPFLARFEQHIRRTRERPKALRLAVTAAAEHYTATLARVVFDTALTEDTTGPMRTLLVWHAAEELEHGAVAFDVLQAVRPGYALRALGFALASTILALWVTRGMRLFIEQSGVSRERLLRDAAKAQRRVGGSKLLFMLLGYLKPGFHPSQTGDLASAHRALQAEGLMPES